MEGTAEELAAAVVYALYTCIHSKSSCHINTQNGIMLKCVLTGLGALVQASTASTVLTVGVAVGVFGRIRVTVAALCPTRSQLYYPDVLHGAMATVVAAALPAILWRSVLDTLTEITLASLNTLNVLHFAWTPLIDRVHEQTRAPLISGLRYAYVRI